MMPIRVVGQALLLCVHLDAPVLMLGAKYDAPPGTTSEWYEAETPSEKWK